MKYRGKRISLSRITVSESSTGIVRRTDIVELKLRRFPKGREFHIFEYVKKDRYVDIRISISELRYGVLENPSFNRRLQVSAKKYNESGIVMQEHDFEMPW